MKKGNLQKRDTKSVKLIAIAKNEAPYLPEWLFHHLYFGFDQIVVYINNSTDNSWELPEALKSDKRIIFKNGDPIFKETEGPPQLEIYKEELKPAAKEGFSHAMFLDIDEFYTPLNFKTTIQQMLMQIDADVCCFEWANKVNETSLFSPPFDVNNHCIKATQVKSVVRSGINAKRMNPHNIFLRGIKYKLTDNSEFIVDDPNMFSKVSKEEQNKPLKDFFILHRITRHQTEYIAALDRGRPLPKSRVTSAFKTNRTGILGERLAVSFTLPGIELEKYEALKGDFMRKYQLEAIVDKGREFVIERYHEVIEKIRSAPLEEEHALRKILKNVSDREVLIAYEEFKQKHNLNN